MLPPLNVSIPRQAAAKRIVLRCGFIGLSFLAVIEFGLLQKTQAAENVRPDRPVSTEPAKLQPKLVPAYGKLPLSFEANRGQLRGPARFLSRGLGYTLFLTSDEAVLSFGKAAGVAPAFKPDPTASVGQPMTDHSVLRMKLIGANAGAAVMGAEELPGKSNYFIGNDPKNWRTNVPNYSQVRCEDVYPGVDLVYYGAQGGQLEYDFVVAPGADTHSIRLSFEGAGKIRVDKRTGDLALTLDGSEVRFRKPVVYQPTPGSVHRADRHAIDGRFVLAGKNQIGFQVAAYNRRVPLIIDPVLIYSTYLGGAKFNLGIRVAVDASGSAYVTGATDSSDFPTTAGVFNSMLHPGINCTYQSKSFACPDAFVTKLNAAGTGIVYSTYLGGSQADGATGISVDSSGSAYVTGVTGSTDFPTTAGAFQTTASTGRAHAFATKLTAAGSALVYSTYLAGSDDDGSTISAVDAGGNLYVAGVTASPDFPTTRGAFQPAIAPGSCGNSSIPRHCADGFISKLNPQGSALVYSTYLGGSNEDGVLGLAVDSAGGAYVTGATVSTDFPTANALYSSPGTTTCGTSKGGKPQPCIHAFVTKINSTGTALAYSTYLAGNGYDSGFGIAVDSTGAAYVTGATNSSQFPTTGGAAQSSFGGGGCGNPSNTFNCPDAFVAKLAPAGSTLAYSTYLGGNSFDFGMGISVDSAGRAYVVGGTNSLDFPVSLTEGNFQGGSCKTMGNVWGYSLSFNIDCPNAFLTEINPAGSTLLFSTYLGGASGDVAFGVAADASGGTYVAGSTLSANFPIVNALQHSMTGYADAFISKFGPAPGVNLSPSALTFAGQVVGARSGSQQVTLSNTGSGGLSITGIATSADFGETDNCEGSVAASGSCTITVTFSPMAAGSLTGTLTITDNDNGVAGSTQTVALSGTGEDFTVAASSGSSTSDTVAPGSPTTYTLSMAGEGGFNQSVSLTCTGAPSEATCTVPNSVTVGSSTTNVTVSVTTTAASSSVPHSRLLPPVPPLSPALRGLLMLALVLAALACVMMRRNQSAVSRWRSTMVPLALGLLLAMALAGCGGGGGGGGSSAVTSNPGTPAGTYTLTVTGTTGSGSSTLSHTVTLTLTVS